MFRIPASYKVLLVVFLSLLALCSLSACASIQGGKADPKLLGETVDKFLSAIRWEEYKAASEFLAPSQRAQFWEDMDLFQRRVRVMDFKVRDVITHEKSPFGQVVILCRFYHTNDPQLLTKTLHQEWRFLEQGKMWQVTRHDLETLILHNAPQ